MTPDQFYRITEWQRNTFPNANALSKAYHLKEEVNELIADIARGTDNRRLEFADCFLLLFGSAAADGMSFEDICNAIDEKMHINVCRKWGMPDANGVVKHINDKES